jgi:hypothetical protein
VPPNEPIEKGRSRWRIISLAVPLQVKPGMRSVQALIHTEDVPTIERAKHLHTRRRNFSSSTWTFDMSIPGLPIVGTRLTSTTCVWVEPFDDFWAKRVIISLIIVGFGGSCPLQIRPLNRFLFAFVPISPVSIA